MLKTIILEELFNGISLKLLKASKATSKFTNSKGIPKRRACIKIGSTFGAIADSESSSEVIRNP